jgi:uncharacterized protein (TIGR00251 family)
LNDAANWCTTRGPDLLLRLRVQPRARTEGVAGVHAGRLRLRVSAPPTDGRANACVVRLLAEILRVPSGHLELLRGHAGRDKEVLVRGAAANIRAVRDALDPPPATN